MLGAVQGPRRKQYRQGMAMRFLDEAGTKVEAGYVGWERTRKDEWLALELPFYFT